MAAERIPMSERMQNKILKDKFPGSRSKSEVCFLVYYPMDMTYSLVQGKNIISPEYPVVKDDVSVKDSKGKTFDGKVVFVGNRDMCIAKQESLDIALEKVLGGDFEHNRVTETSDAVNDNSTEKTQLLPNKASSKQKASSTASSSRKRPRKSPLESDSDEDFEEEGVLKPADEISDELTKEAKRVHSLLMVSQQKALPSKDGNHNILDAFKEVTARLDDIKVLIQNLIDIQTSKIDEPPLPVFTPPQKRLKTGQTSGGSVERQSRSPNVTEDPETVDISNKEQFIVDGVNLLQDVPAKFKKPNLYATSLLSHLFTDEEMRNGAVEPNENCKKRALDQEKINLIKEYISIKYGEKTLEKKVGSISGPV